jgi:hypothetical protein
MKTACTSRIGFFNSRIVIGFALYATGLFLVFGAMNSVAAGDNAAAELSVSIPTQATGGTWTATGDLGTPRSGHTATLLPNDQVLVAGGVRLGEGFVPLASAQLYHPAIGSWQRIANMNHTHFDHTATLLTNGQVLVAGGVGCNSASSLSRCGPSELYDPTTRTWTDTGSLRRARWSHTATLLPNGQVLVAGGQNNKRDFPSAELYDPATGVWTATGSMATARFSHTATLLPNGQVLVTGGFMFGTGTLATAELYDPATGVWRATSSMATARWHHEATLLPNGQVLVAGGLAELSSTYLASAELYDPATGMWTATGSMAIARDSHTATLLPDGQVLVAGGHDFITGSLVSAELYESTPEGLDIQ